ncbi:MAG TPA: DUF5666 domain-containing protein [Thermoanaerobaculia bacterium]|nr:DUF5666 domain-containing protein [Thermoanaerobaculia bacterium]HQR67334.1 DUF5666 domain-containing protein [Thermoanaerobaculia bacterium]
MSTPIARRLRAPRPTWFLALPASGIVALLFLVLRPGTAGAQMAAGSEMASVLPVAVPAAVNGIVTSFDETTRVATLIGSRLLQVDLSSARIVAGDADPSDAVVPPISPGAHLTALVVAPDVAITIFPPPPLKALHAVVRPPDYALLQGEIESVGTDSFSMLHRVVLVDGRTVFAGEDAGSPIRSLADLKPGMQAEVWVVAAGDTLTAVRVVAHGKSVEPPPMLFQGVVKEIGAASWTIGDRTVGVTAETKIVGDPKVGDTVDVVARIVNPPDPMMGMPSRLVAVSIVKVLLPPPPVPGETTSFDGPVQAMPPTGTLGLWRIADRMVLVTGLTKIDGSPAVGSKVTVTGYTLPTMAASPAGTDTSGMSPMASPFIALSITTKS